MSPSRGLNIFLRARISSPRQCQYQYQHGRSISTRVANSLFVQKATSPTSRTLSQIYISRSSNPYLNLSIEHFLLQNTHADSTILFLYINRPCVVIGRNQNPWVEVNLAELKKNHVKVDLVRRRSGGGAVFHDVGNVNYSVICPTAQFDRDKHAEMVVRALKKLGQDRARVNQRHDIVLDPNPKSKSSDGVAKKVSGSAYKLTRLRSLHHGTCLVDSPMLLQIGKYLSSPAKPYITARGVDSVPSPVTNVAREGTPTTTDFIKAVTEEFQEMYDVTEPFYVDEREKDVPDIKAGMQELKLNSWMLGQTPQFTFEMTKTNPDSNPVHSFSLNFTARNLKFTDFNLTISGHNIPPTLSTEINNTILSSPQRFYTFDWPSTLLSFAPAPSDLTTAKATADIRSALQYTGEMLNTYLNTKGGPFRITAQKENDNEFQKSEMERITREQETEKLEMEQKMQEMEKIAAEEERLAMQRKLEEEKLEAQRKAEDAKSAKEWQAKLTAMKELKFKLRTKAAPLAGENKLSYGRRSGTKLIPGPAEGLRALSASEPLPLPSRKNDQDKIIGANRQRKILRHALVEKKRLWRRAHDELVARERGEESRPEKEMGDEKGRARNAFNVGWDRKAMLRRGNVRKAGLVRKHFVGGENWGRPVDEGMKIVRSGWR